MTIKLLLLKSGEDMIASVAEMGYGEGEDRRVVGYYLNKPCVIKMRDPNVLDDESEGRGRKAGYEVSLFPWIPLSAENRTLVQLSQVVTIYEPHPEVKSKWERLVEVHHNESVEDRNSPILIPPYG